MPVEIMEQCIVLDSDSNEDILDYTQTTDRKPLLTCSDGDDEDRHRSALQGFCSGFEHDQHAAIDLSQSDPEEGDRELPHKRPKRSSSPESDCEELLPLSLRLKPLLKPSISVAHAPVLERQTSISSSSRSCASGSRKAVHAISDSGSDVESLPDVGACLGILQEPRHSQPVGEIFAPLPTPRSSGVAQPLVNSKEDVVSEAILAVTLYGRFSDSGGCSK